MGTIYKRVGSNIRKFRKRNGISQERLALKAGVDPKSVVKIEAGERNPTLKTIKKIASVLGVDPVDLLK